MLTSTNRSICNVSSINPKNLLIKCVGTFILLYYVLVISIPLFGRTKLLPFQKKKKSNFDIIGFKVLHDLDKRV